jgi:hypothetical protein
LKITPKTRKNLVNNFGSNSTGLTFALPYKKGMAINGQRSLKVGKQQHPAAMRDQGKSSEIHSI